MAREPDLAERAASATGLPDPHDIVGRDEEIPLRELFDEAFVQEYTEFETFDEMVAASPSEVDSADDLGLVTEGTWDDFVAAHTVFADEEELVFTAIDDWVAERLGL